MNYRKWKHVQDSEAKGENGQDLVRNVRDIFEVICLNMLGQSACGDGKRWLERWDRSAADHT